MVFCTVFDSNYLDKGVLMYQSLEKTAIDFKLYVVCLDENAYKILKSLSYAHLIPIDFETFLSPELRVAQSNRSRSEFCWTCSSCAIEYVLKVYHEDMCTYIDADLYFYSDPQVLFDELAENSIGIIEHRNNHNFEGRYYDKMAGPYCVEFNTFRNDFNGLLALTWWKNKCLESCSSEINGRTFGDQKYLEDWKDRFNNLHVYKNLGAGMAPWNIAQYNLKEGKVYYRKDIVVPVFYHFHAIEYLDEDHVNINVFYRDFKTDSNLVHLLYADYLSKISQTRKMIEEEFDFTFSRYKHTKKVPIAKRLFKKRTVSEYILSADVYTRKLIMKSKDKMKT